MTPADLRALAADHAHLRHNPHEVAAALVAAAELIEHHEKRVAELIGVANALSVELRDAVQGGEPVAWQWLDTGHFRKKLPRGARVNEWRKLYTSPVERHKPITDGEIDTALRTTDWAPGTSLDARCHAVARWVERMHGIGMQDGIKEAP